TVTVTVPEVSTMKSGEVRVVEPTDGLPDSSKTPSPLFHSQPLVRTHPSEEAPKEKVTCARAAAAERERIARKVATGSFITEVFSMKTTLLKASSFLSMSSLR